MRTVDRMKPKASASPAAPPAVVVSPPRSLARSHRPWFQRVWAPGVAVHLALATAAIFRRDLWYDEAISLAATRHLASTAVHTGGNMIGYYVLLTPWAWVAQAPAWLRLPSVVAMTWAIGLASLLVARIAGASAGRWAGLFAACAFMPVRYAAEVRSYAFVALLVTACWYSADRILAGDARLGHRRAYRWCTIALPLFHGLAVLQALALAAVVLWARPSRAVRRQILVPCGVSLAICAVLYSAGARRMGSWIDPMTVRSVAHFTRRMVAPYLAVSVVLLLIAAAGAWALLRRSRATPLDRWRNLVLVAWGPGAAALLLALSVVRPSQLDRYAIASVLGFAGLLAVAVTRPAARPVRAIAPLLVLSMIALGQGELVVSTHDWAYATATVAERMQADDAVVFVPAESRLMYEASMVAPPVQQGPKVAGPGSPLGTFDRFGATGSWVSVRKEACAADRLWVISDASSGGAGDPSSLTSSGCIATTFEVSQTWTSGPVTIQLLRRR